MTALAEWDPEIAYAIQQENERQRKSIVLIASENYASRGVMEAQATVLNNKYAEGYPGKRYYGGCQFVDVAEQLAIDRAKALFHAEHANVQPHSGAQANMAAYFGLLEPGDTVMGMRLDQGGHLTHGSPVNFSGKLYNFVAYGVRRDTETIDYDEVERLAMEHKPQSHSCGVYRIPTHDRLRAIPADRRHGRRHRDGGHGSHCRPYRRGYSSLALTSCSGDNFHDSEDTKRSTWRAYPVHRRAQTEHRQGGFPIHPGRPLYARYCRQGCLLW